ncbi:hypothetical protein N7522_012006 [Penicillium canescens]|uniref:uncharacterized protein n=1 Tax=Penicillium canescens TaxID=5083 RepID=UPI0026E07070|nr:uncharacterized protein N7446_013944 [Penicillium canescens]KAJ5984810.1 hypothetical protein N7522_012006 [Penicillium canescens]KAJ6025143.1 hypothetical protein N7444_012822 [Penicillium canescens]KAJ6042878.1 hypothetical protein N7446_013944 [Penicillium canescens]
MSLIEPNQSLFKLVKDKVVIITGGARGIGRSVAFAFHGHGAKVVVGDVNVEEGKSLVSLLGKTSDQLALFQEAAQSFGHVDIVIANAAVAKLPDPLTVIEDINEEPPLPEVDINLRGVLFTSRIATHYLRRHGGGDLILVSSIGGFKETAELTPYLATKHGVIGVMRGLRMTSLNDNIRVNVICPWTTRTILTKTIAAAWEELGLPMNEPEDVATSILICATAGRSNGATHDGSVTPFHGKILLVAGGKSFEIEDNLQSLEPQWLGEHNSQALAMGQDFLHNGKTSWHP